MLEADHSARFAMATTKFQGLFYKHQYPIPNAIPDMMQYYVTPLSFQE